MMMTTDHVPGCDGLDPLLGRDTYHCPACARNAVVASVLLAGLAVVGLVVWLVVGVGVRLL
jgi:hypothetical protein